MSGRGELVPKVVDGSALEYREEEEDKTDDGGQRDCGVKNPGVNSINGDSKEGDDD